METNKQFCPICNSEVMPMQRYPDYVCESCAVEVTDLNGELVEFYNESISGGLVAHRKNPASGRFDFVDPELSKNPIVIIRNVKCFAAEAKFGGIVFRPYKK